MSTLLNGTSAGQPVPYILHPLDRMNRMVGFVEVLRMGFEQIAREHDKQFERYTVICDAIVEEITMAVDQLRGR